MISFNIATFSDYESKLISPLIKRKKIRHRKRLKKVVSNVELLTDSKPEVEEGNEGDISDTDDEEQPVNEKVVEKVAEIKEVETKKCDTLKSSTSDSKLENLPSTSKGIFKPSKSEKFQYGNYNQYYGYRNPGNIEDLRLQFFKSTWFEDKDVLDIGCNIGIHN